MAKDFTVLRPSPKWVLNKDGELVQFADDFPSFEFNPNGTYRGMFVEEGSRNYDTTSSTITGWTSVNTTKTVDQTTAPDGVAASADEVLETTVNDTHIVRKDYTLVAGSYVFSCFVKSIGSRNFQLLTQALGAGGSGGGTVRFNLSTGAVISGTGTITEIGDGWYRVSGTAVTAGATGVRIIAYSLDGSATNFAGDITKGFYMWGVQLEKGPTATSYIKTEGQQETRNEDVITMSDASQYIPSQGAVVMEWEQRKADTIYIGALSASVTAGIRKLRFEYSSTEQKLFIDDFETAVDETTGDFDFSGMDKIELGHINETDQPNTHIRYFAIV